MTVVELIKALTEMPAEATVLIHCYETGHETVIEPRIVHASFRAVPQRERFMFGEYNIEEMAEGKTEPYVFIPGAQTK